ncbi:hypothetical protein HY285_04155 [Candidatus Peregrinibacteria bacterium]|nr:hypothetical protein [Candidatus Peregrinibacteria bacterium]MBI3816706.1 hypothetical protein [Candidatus Peregrinibacteria bacterium]
MWCCSRKTLLILFGVAGLFGLLIATGKVNAYAIVPILPFLACPLMCGVMLLFGRRGCSDGTCDDMKKKSSKAVSAPPLDAKN